MFRLYLFQFLVYTENYLNKKGGVVKYQLQEKNQARANTHVTIVDR